MIKKFFAVLMIPVLCAGMALSTTGCTKTDVQSSINLIVAELPTAVNLLQIVLQLTATFAVANGADQSVIVDINKAGEEVKVDVAILQDLLTTYNTNPSAANFDKIVAVVDKLVADTDGTILDAAHIKDANTRMEVQATLASLDAVVHIIDGYIIASENKTQLKRSVAARSVKLSTIAPLLDKKIINAKVAPYGMNFDSVVALETAMGF